MVLKFQDSPHSHFLTLLPNQGKHFMRPTYAFHLFQSKLACLQVGQDNFWYAVNCRIHLITECSNFVKFICLHLVLAWFRTPTTANECLFGWWPYLLKMKSEYWLAHFSPLDLLRLQYPVFSQFFIFKNRCLNLEKGRDSCQPIAQTFCFLFFIVASFIDLTHPV